MRGFTLLELLVVISIIAILTVVAVPSFNQYSQSQKLNDAANNLQSVLRQAQNNAQAGTTCNISGTVYKAFSWVVTLNSDKYNVFPACDFQIYPAPTLSSQQYLLPSGVIISSVQAGDIDPSTNNLKSTACGITPNSTTTTAGIEYKNLSSDVTFNLNGCTPGVNAAMEITLCLTDSNCLVGSLTKIVRVEKGGGIYVKQ